MNRGASTLQADAPSAQPAKETSVKEHIENVLAWVFGGIFLMLAAVVTVETISRKVFNISLQGADELGGYALAVGCTLAFSLALMGRNHIRVDVFHDRMSRRAQAFLNWFSIVSIAAFGIFVAWVSTKVITDTLHYGSTAQTPWATPLVVPQSVWYGGLVIFALVATGYAVRATLLLVAGRTEDLNHDFHPKSAKEELKEELDDLAQRQAAEGAKP
ncbi:MAG TPA: TRAP transporter small permease [Variovorax sp.]|nr:TRAP transporter small permease [Variovorax sp.]